MGDFAIGTKPLAANSTPLGPTRDQRVATALRTQDIGGPRLMQLLNTPDFKSLGATGLTAQFIANPAAERFRITEDGLVNLGAALGRENKAGVQGAQAACASLVQMLASAPQLRNQVQQAFDAESPKADRPWGAGSPAEASRKRLTLALGDGADSKHMAELVASPDMRNFGLSRFVNEIVIPNQERLDFDQGSFTVLSTALGLETARGNSRAEPAFRAMLRTLNTALQQTPYPKTVEGRRQQQEDAAFLPQLEQNYRAATNQKPNPGGIYSTELPVQLR